MNLEFLKSCYSKSPSFVKKVYSFVPWEWRMGPEYRKTLNFLYESQHWSEGEWRSYQALKLREIMKHCQNNVPYYRRVFAENGVDATSSNIWKEFSKIPPIDKSVVTQNIKEFLPSNFPKKKFYSATTGGTTGKPMQVFYEPACFAREWAYKIFFWNLAIGYTPEHKKATFRGVSFEGKLCEVNPIYNEIRFSPFLLDTEKISEIVTKLISYSPAYLHGYPSALEQLANYFIKNNIQFMSLKGVILISENIFPHQREVIAEAFDCPTYSFYGHSERLIFASMGPQLNEYYAHPAYGITELLNEDEKPISSYGESGELVGTGFINKGMPLLRFKTGDYSHWVESSGELEMPALDQIKGRWDQEYLMGSNRKKVSLTSLNMHSDVYVKVKGMQYFQDTPGVVTLNIIKEIGYSEKDEKNIYQEHIKKLGDQFDINFSYVSSLEKTISGKAKYLIQLIGG